MDFNYLLPNGRSLTTGKLRGKWTTSVSVRSSISYSYLVASQTIMLEIKTELLKSSQTCFNSFKIKAFLLQLQETPMGKEMTKWSKNPRPRETTIPHEAGPSCSACKNSYHTCLNEPENVYAKHILVLLLVFMDLPVCN